MCFEPLLLEDGKQDPREPLMEEASPLGPSDWFRA